MATCCTECQKEWSRKISFQSQAYLRQMYDYIFGSKGIVTKREQNSGKLILLIYPKILNPETATRWQENGT